MTLCCLCGKDRPLGAVNASGDFECGRCTGAGSVAQRPARGNGRVRP